MQDDEEDWLGPAMTMEQVLDEPIRLANELSVLQQQEEALAMQNYKAFIRTSEVVNAMKTPIAEIGERLARVAGTSLPSLSTQLATFSEHMGFLKQATDRNRLTLEQQLQLYELVEIPQAMESYVQKGATNLEFYDHALALHAFAHQVGAIYPDLQFVQRIVASVQASANVLVNEFKNLLRQPIQLAVCLRIIGFLRRLGMLSEEDLRSTFLACRQAYLHMQVVGIDTSGPAYSIVNKLIDVSRSALFDIITQYRAIFIDENDVLHLWVSRQVADFLEKFELYMADITEGSHTWTLLDQSMYFAASLGRLGADFRPLLVPIFTKTIQRIFDSGIHAAVQKLFAGLKTFHWAEQSRVLSYYAGKNNYSLFDPPTLLLQYPPLAVFCNGCLATLNELRHVALDQIEHQTRSSLETTLDTVSAEIKRLDPSLFPSPDVHTQLVSTTEEILRPYLLRAFDRIYKGDGK